MVLLLSGIRLSYAYLLEMRRRFGDEHGDMQYTLHISNHMALICQNCGTVNQDPGGDPRVYRCGVCGQQRLKRTLSEQDKRRLISAIAGASVLGLATENPIGALIGGILGYVFGDQIFK